MNCKKSALLTFLMVIVMLLQAIPAHAVFEEKDLPHTLGILKLELERKYETQKELMERRYAASAAQHATLIEYLQRSEQISLILYSQNSEFTFDVAYACQQATELYHGISTKLKPFDKIRDKIIADIERYDSLICALKKLPPSIHEDNKVMTAEDSIAANLITDSTQIKTPENQPKAPSKKSLFQLSELDQKDRDDCIRYATALRQLLADFLVSLDEDAQHYEVVIAKVTALNAYAQERYKDLQNSIFANSQSNYFETLSNLPRHWLRAKRDIEEKYMPLSNNKNKHSQWRGPVVLGVSIFMLIYIIFATLISNLLMRWIPAITSKLFPHFAHKVAHLRHHIISDEDYKKKRFVIIFALGILIFSVALSIVDNYAKLNIMHMANTLMVNFAWLIEAILISLLIRLSASQIREGVRAYIPFLWMALIVIFFRITLTPNTLINIICPPLLLILTLWQLLIFRKRKQIPLSDSILSSMALVVMITSCIFSWFGLTLFAVQIIIWWTFQLACIETIILCQDLLKKLANDVITLQIIAHAKSFGEKKRMIEAHEGANFFTRMEKGEYINKTWLYDLCRITIVPTAAVISIPFSIYCAAGIFEMKEAFLGIFNSTISITSFVGAISIMRITIAIALFFLFKYISFLFNALYLQIRRKHEVTGGILSNETLARNIIGIIVWGVYILGILAMFRVPWTGITIVFTGLATGMGFAMKDLLENFFYGISLMSGRVRVGDFIECDGIRGKVESISYQSTQIITDDGSIMAFLNSALFNKNFKNLTKNNRYEFTSIPVGIVYGSNIDEVRNYIIDALQPLCTKTEDGRDLIDPNKSIDVRFSGFGDNSVDLSVISWALVDKRGAMIAKFKEAIYNTLNEHNIEIPYPQRDIYIKNYEK